MHRRVALSTLMPKVCISVHRSAHAPLGALFLGGVQLCANFSWPHGHLMHTFSGHKLTSCTLCLTGGLLRAYLSGTCAHFVCTFRTLSVLLPDALPCPVSCLLHQPCLVETFAYVFLFFGIPASAGARCVRRQHALANEERCCHVHPRSEPALAPRRRWT